MRMVAYSIFGLLLAAGTAQAQSDDAPADAPASPALPAPEANSPAAEVSAATVTDAEIDSFAKATVKLQAIRDDTSIADDQKQSRMQAAVTESGLDPTKYNAIGKAAQADPALREKLQTAMAKHAGHTDG